MVASRSSVLSKNIHSFEPFTATDKSFGTFIIPPVSDTTSDARASRETTLLDILGDADHEMTGNKRKLHRSPPNHIRIAESLQAQKLWKMGHRGQSHHVALPVGSTFVLLMIQVLEFT